MHLIAPWKGAPFIRLVAALCGGIVLQRYAALPLLLTSLFCGTAVLLLIVYSMLSSQWKFRLRISAGIIVHVSIGLCGSLLLYSKDIRNNRHWVGHLNQEKTISLLTVEEPLVEKPASWKTVASVTVLFKNNTTVKACGRIIIYFKKDSLISALRPGSRILCSKPLEGIRSSSNPGGFDFKRYALFNGITHQVYLTPGDFFHISNEPARVRNFIVTSRKWIIGHIRQNIKGDKEAGLAEALLIGYKDDLDKDLVDAYAATGVVHVIAISGLHLGLIYALLLLLTKPVKQVKYSALIRLLIIVSSLWIFSFLAGAQPSVLRSAVMFSFIALGETMGRRGSVFNTLALSAFVLLCYQPFWLWDAGFQLSYTAVTSILIFFRPVYNVFYCSNKLVDALWKANAVTISAQLLTLPVSLYHFHQFPLLFLFSNLVAVPLSGIILFGEIILCCLYFLPWAAQLCASLIEPCIKLMNHHVEVLALLPFATWNGLLVTSLQCLVLMVLLLSAGYWLMEQNRGAFWIAISCTFIFVTLRMLSFVTADRRQQLVVYNLPKSSAIEWIDGRNAILMRDSAVINRLYRMHLQPAHVLYRISSTRIISHKTAYFMWGDKKILVISSAASDHLPDGVIDLLIISGNNRLYIPALLQRLQPKTVVLDGSVSAWRSIMWKKECVLQNIQLHDTKEKGAFVMHP